MMSVRLNGFRTLAMACVLSLAAGFLPPPGASAATTYHVSAASGSLTGNGTTTPFKTISQCAAAMTEGDTCIIESGTYRETVTPANSGTSTAPIRYEAAAGATVVVSGTEPLGGWSVHSGNIYVANFTGTLPANENQLFIKNGATVTPLWEARWPNIDAYSLPELKEHAAVADQGQQNQITDDALIATGVNWNGAKIWVRGGNAYQGMTSQVNSYNATTGVLTYAPITGDYAALYPKTGSTYFLSGILAALDAPNEWYVDTSAQKVYLWAPGGGAPTNVEVKKRKTAFNLNGKNYIQLAGIQTFAANITMNGSNNNLLDGVKAEYVYFSNYSQNTTNPDQLNGGIAIVGSNNEIKNSTIAYSSGTLINIDGSNNRIVNNYIHDGSYMASYDPLLKLTSGTNNVISSNKLENSGRYIIYWNNGIAEISYNDISNGMWLSRDGALIYAWGTDLGNSNIHHNLIHDAVHGSTANDMRVGLYFDNYTENVVAHHNVIYNNDVGIQMNTPGNYKLIYNNTVVGNPTASIGYGGDSSSPYKSELYGTRVFNNIFTDPVSMTEDVVRGFNTITDAGLNFANAANKNFRLNIDSTAVNMGAIIPGITDGYVDAAPDAGAYEYGGTDWTAGIAAPAPTSYVPVATPYMNRVYNSGFEKLLEGWTPWTTSSATATDSSIEGTYANSDFRKRGVRTRLKLGAGGGVEQLITGLLPNTTYKFVAWVYTDTGGQAINVGVLNYGGTAIDVSQSTANQYVRKEVEFTTGATNTSARVRIWRAAGATGNAYADDTGLFETAAYNPGVYKNQAAGKTTITASGALGFPERLTDGVKTAYSNMDDTGPQWVKIDLGRSYELDKINLLHYYTATDIRTYHDVIVQLSNDSTFATKTTVFNNDTDNSAGQGTGTDGEYQESENGKDISFAKTNARYIRLWSNGSTKYDTQHYTEVEAWGVPAVTPTSPLQGRKNVAPLAKDARITFSSALGNPNRVTDGDKTTGAFANQDGPSGGPASPQWVQLDLGQKFRIDQIKLWHFIAFDRIYYDVIIQLSNDPTFPASGTTTVFNNDADNTAGQGNGTDPLYADNAAGKTVNFPLTTARYVRLWANGNQNNNSQHYVEVEVYGSPDYGMGT